METLHSSDSDHMLQRDVLAPWYVDAVTLGLSIGVTCRAAQDASVLLRGFRPLAGASCHRDHGNGARRFHPGLPIFIGSLPLLTVAWYDLTHTYVTHVHALTNPHAHTCSMPRSSPVLVHLCALHTSVTLPHVRPTWCWCLMSVSSPLSLYRGAETHTRMHTNTGTHNEDVLFFF